MPLKRKTLILVGLLWLSGCQSTTETVTMNIDFKEIYWYAERAKAAYQTEKEILKILPNTTRVTTIEEIDVQYFIEDIPGAKAVVISVRGTNNMTNVREDAEYIPSKNSQLDIYVHKGFDESTMKIYQDIKPHLSTDKELRFTGHSLGAAISTLLMMYFHADGFNIGPSINFGQPKITNKKGSKAYGFLPLTRVVDENDVVPQLPPATLLDSIHGAYAHLGQEVILLEGIFFSYLDQHMARNVSVDSFWDNLGELSLNAHRIKHYISNIEPKLSEKEQVDFDNRKKFFDD